MNRPFPSTFAAVLGLALLATGCAGDLEPVETLRSGPYQIAVLAPGGTLRSGDNRIAVQVTRDGQPVAVQQGQLGFAMPAMGTMPAMQAPAQLEPDEGGLTGTLTFSMGGGWNGQVRALTATGPVGGSFKVQVAE
jgi:Cu(I)/Ag(I) efflux system membrane fusion protein